MMDPVVEAGTPRKAGAAGFFAWFPWEKTLIWALFLLLVYALRHFFFIIFMTFMIAYIMSNLVRRTMRMVSPHQERVWLQRLLSVAAFILLIGFLYGVGTFLYHPLRKQAEDLVSYARTVNIDSAFNEILERTIGAWQFEAKYRKEGEHKKQADFENFLLVNPHQTYEEFGKEIEKYQSEFRNAEILAEGESRFRELERDGKSNTALTRWLLDNVAERSFQEKRNDLIEEWVREREGIWLLKKFPAGSSSPTIQEVRKSPEYEEERDREIKEGIVAKIIAGEDRKKYIEDFKRDLGRQEFERLSAQDRLEERFQKFYERQRLSPLSKSRNDYDYKRFQRLRSAWEQGRDAFETELEGVQETPEEKEARLWKVFRRNEEKTLLAEALNKKDLPFLEIENVKRLLRERVPEFTKWLGNAGIYLLELVGQFGLSLLLSFFITFDLPRLQRGIHRLETSRVRDFYNEIAPSLQSFGRLIGRAFQAQGVIALCNTILTFFAIKLLGIESEVFLCSIVFICSFIPVLGVVFSSVPIAVMAIIQPGGDYGLALKAIGAILVIHFIEASILNPKILGDMLHLHPVLVLGILAVGQYFFGVWGLLLGVPVAVYIIRHVILAEETALSSQVASGAVKATGIREKPRDSHLVFPKT